MTRRLALLPATAMLALGVADTASGATIATTRACLNSLSPAQFVGSGFTPGAEVILSGEFVGTTATAGPGGELVAPFTAPIADVTAPPEPFAFTASDGTTTATGSALVATPGAVLPAFGQTRIQMRIRLTGYEPGRVLYAHLRWGRAWRRTVRLGTAAGPCGTVDVRRKLLRKSAGRRGREVYVQFDSSRRPAADTHQTAYARFTVRAGSNATQRPENYKLVKRGWRERTGI